MATSGISGRTGTDGQTPIPPSAARSSELADLRFAVVGAGRLGIALASALGDAGATLAAHTSRSAAGRERGGRALGLPASVSIEDLAARASAADASVYVLAVPDDALPDVARALAEALAATAPRPSGSVTTRAAACHTSGATTVDVLAPLGEQGMATFSFHPLQTFGPGAGAQRLRGVSVAVTAGPSSCEAPDPTDLGFRMARAVGARPFVLQEGDRALYHAAACMASNYLVTLEHLAERLFIGAGLDPGQALPALMPLVEGTVDNLRDHGTVGALTGPLSRGDVGTIGRHLRALALDAPEALETYSALGRATLDVVRESDRVAEETINSMDELLTRPAGVRTPLAAGSPLSMTVAPTADTAPPPPRRPR